jgi:hypothetical protein
MSTTGNYNPLKSVQAKIVDGEIVFKIDDNPWSATIPGAAGHEVILNPMEVKQIKITYVLELVPDSTD